MNFNQSGGKMSKGHLSLSGFFLIIFLIISYFALTNEILAFDTVIREYIYELRNENLTLIMKSITYLGNWQTITVLCFFLLLFSSTRMSFGVPLSATAIISAMLQKLLKNAFHRERPDIALHLIQQGGFSFPSGHSMTVLVFYGMMIYLCRQKMNNRTAANIVTVLLFLLIFFIGLSRIYLGVHYPTDVLGGWAIGSFLLLLLTQAVFSLQRKN